jgi:hypothetical protein
MLHLYPYPFDSKEKFHAILAPRPQAVAVAAKALPRFR